MSAVNYSAADVALLRNGRWVRLEQYALEINTLRAQLEAAEAEIDRLKKVAQFKCDLAASAAARAEAAEAECARLRVDAERYRWLKSNHLQQWSDTKTGAVSSCDFSFEAIGTWEMDAAIDSEIARTKAASP